jgi:hypothetical protein
MNGSPMLPLPEAATMVKPPPASLKVMPLVVMGRASPGPVAVKLATQAAMITRLQRDIAMPHIIVAQGGAVKGKAHSAMD